VQIVLRSRTPQGVEVVLPAIIHAKIVEQHAAVADSNSSTGPSRIRITGDRTCDRAASVSFVVRVISGFWSWVTFSEVPAIIVTAINAQWLLNRDGELVATLRDGRQLRLHREDLAGLIH
jgi:hypothetical protein